MEGLLQAPKDLPAALADTEGAKTRWFSGEEARGHVWVRPTTHLPNVGVLGWAKNYLLPAGAQKSWGKGACLAGLPTSMRTGGGPHQAGLQQSTRTQENWIWEQIL